MWAALIGTAVALIGSFGASGMSVLKPVADAGTYTGTAGGFSVTFFVAPSRTSVVNISVPLTGLACSPGGAGANDRTFVIAKAVIRNGTFNAKGSQSGAFGGYAARFSYSFSGRFTKATKQHTATAAGSFRDDVRYTDRTGAHLLCTTNKQAWTAARTGPLATPANLVKPGNYTGTAGGFGLTFVAAASKRSLTTISIPLTGLGCFPSGSGANDRTFTIPQTAVRADGSFERHSVPERRLRRRDRELPLLLQRQLPGPEREQRRQRIRRLPRGHHLHRHGGRSANLHDEHGRLDSDPHLVGVQPIRTCSAHGAGAPRRT